MLSQTANQTTKPMLKALVMEPMTDEEIRELAAMDWLGVMAKLWSVFGKPLDPDALTIYQEMLDGVPLGLLEKAIRRVVREHKYNSVPTVAEVWTAVRKELGNPEDVDQAIESWVNAQFKSAVYRFETVTAVTAEVES